MADAHYHCDVCDDGDYDLCETCVGSGVHCPSENHWLVKRFVKNGQVVSSTTERFPPKHAASNEAVRAEMPGAFTEHVEEKKPEVMVESAVLEASRTCNSCVKGEFSSTNLGDHDSSNNETEDQENRFVTCLDCPDYDLCISCHEANIHGHHPAHKFKAVGEDVVLSPLAEFLCAPGRNTKHAALCDGCDKVSLTNSIKGCPLSNMNQPIFGVRHKCLNCPDWDYCSECVKNAAFIHPGHRFAPLYEPITSPRYRKTRHIGIHCDGPLCQNKHDYIEGTRYKCAICHDTDFCASCEAYPHNKHNHTHPLIQFKTPVRNATITTVHEDQYGRSLAPKGDRSAAKAESSKAPTNAATQVQTIIDVKPAEAPAYKPSKEKIEIKDLLAEPIQEKMKVQDLLSSPVQESKRPVDVSELNAIFVREVVQDGSQVNPNASFTQVWELRNPGPAAWPAGCKVQFTGGDNMFWNMAMVAESNSINRVVEVGDEVAFRVPLKAPMNAGTKISYWRLKTADGQAFGHRLWCHVNVTHSAAPVSNPLPEVAPATWETPKHPQGQWRDNFLQQALQHRLDRAQAIEKQRAEFEKIRARQEAKQLADTQAKANRAEMLRRLSSEITAVETQHKARMAAAKAAVDAARAAKAPMQQASELPAAAPVPLSHLVGSPPQEVAQTMKNNHALQDFQMQIMLLEQQNKKRLAMQQEAEQKAAREATVPQVLQPFVPSPISQYPTPTPEQIRAREHGQREAAKKPAPVEVEAEVKPVTVEDVVDEEDAKPEEKSNMIFPKLDKESPVSSTVDVSAAPAPASPAKSVKTESEIFEDAESVSFVDSSDEEDGFLTDEEYDILDASDEDIAA
jgi:next-to-BRCA1 protein 1